MNIAVMKRLSLILLLSFACVISSAQKFDTPLIGAQVFIEPGQTAEDIDDFFCYS